MEELLGVYMINIYLTLSLSLSVARVGVFPNPGRFRRAPGRPGVPASPLRKASTVASTCVYPVNARAKGIQAPAAPLTRLFNSTRHGPVAVIITCPRKTR